MDKKTMNAPEIEISKAIKMRLLIMSIVVLVSIQLHGQKKQNLFLPEIFLVQDVVYTTDSDYAKNDFIKYPLVQKYTPPESGTDVAALIIRNAILKELTVYEPLIDPFFPYSVYELKTPTDPLINFESKALAAENLASKASGLSFIEVWNFDTTNFSFTKTVISTEPVITYEKYGMQLTKIPFRIIYPENVTEMTEQYLPAGKVEYEFLLAPVFAYNHIIDQDNLADQGTSGYYDLPIKNYYGNNYRHAPLFSGYAKRQLIRYLLSSTLSGNIPAYDYTTGEELSIEEITGRLFSKDKITIPGPNGIMKDTVIKNPYPAEEFNSLIFTEDWSVDEAQGHIKKNVLEIALVRGYTEYTEAWEESGNPEDLVWKKDVVFKVKLK